MAPRPEERDEDWDDLESGDLRGEQSGEVSPMESEEGLLAPDRANDRAADPADNGEEGSDPEPDMGQDQNKDA